MTVSSYLKKQKPGKAFSPYQRRGHYTTVPGARYQNGDRDCWENAGCYHGN